jgi:hypothetical protein
MLYHYSHFKDGRPTGNMVKSGSTQCDLIYACEGSYTTGNSSPVGGGLQGKCNIMEAVVDVVQFF